MRGTVLAMASFAAVMIATGSRAGELRLVNGAVIPGELLRAEAHHLVWKADLIGEIRVPRPSVRSFDGDTALAQRRQAPSGREDSGKLTVSLDLERGDTAAEDQLDVDARAVRRRGQRRHTFEGSVDYEQNPSRTTEDEAELLYQGDYLLRDGWFVYGMSEYRRDREAAIQESLLVGAGAGYEFSPAGGVNLRLQAGLSEVQFNLDGPGKEITEAGTIRWRGGWETPWRGIEFAHEGDYGVVFEDTDIYLVETKTSLSLPIARGLTGELRLDWDRYGISPEGGGRTEIEWVLGLGYRW